MHQHCLVNYRIYFSYPEAAAHEALIYFYLQSKGITVFSQTLK